MPQRQDDIYAHVTAQIVELIESGTALSWKPSWVEAQNAPLRRHRRAARLMAATGAKFTIGGDRLHYYHREDFIALPSFGSYETVQEFYAYAFMQFIHWTRHFSRLNRYFETDYVPAQNHAREEIVAALGSAFICAHVELSPAPFPGLAGYIARMLGSLGCGPSEVYAFVAHARQAANYLIAFESNPNIAARCERRSDLNWYRRQQKRFEGVWENRERQPTGPFGV